MTKVLTIVGARPQFVKASALSRAMAATPGVSEVLVHTGQHYDDDMSAVFFRELGLRTPDVNLGVSGGPHGQMTGRMLERLESVMLEQRPDAVLVYGDTNSTLAGALAAAKLAIPIVHVEAGLRSFRRAMPEELNRVVTDRVSSLLCCPTRTAVKNLQREGFDSVLAGGDLADGADLEGARKGPWVANTGDVMLDVLRHYRPIAAASSDVLRRLGLARRGYAVLTVHRAESASRIDEVRPLLNAVGRLSERVPVVFPIHPRTRALLSDASEESRLTAYPRLRIVDPLSYLDFLQLQANAAGILTDSGGVQKEAFFLGVPCLTFRDETEWPETVQSGWNRLVGCRPTELFPVFEEARPAPPPTTLFGSGDASERIVKLMCAALAHD